MSGLTPANRRNKIIGGYAPSWLLSWGVNRYLVPTAGAPWLARCQTGLSPPDRKYLEDPLAARKLVADNWESLAKGGKGQGLARVSGQNVMFIQSRIFDFQDHAIGYNES